ncbi:penicillin-binding protein 1C [Bdellovibrio bacteriovorus]|uniref:penicillin-binding protein 1C n=1 Tax=Bdellovibrio bacteriovorus TaxID=959 RepID=UPI0035A7392C
MRKKRLLYGLLGFSLCCASAAVLLWPPPETPSYDQVRNAYKSSELYVLDRNGKLLHQQRHNQNGRSFAWVGLQDVSPALQKAVLKSEDARFFEHSGVDAGALGASLYQRLFKNSPRGGSTISMQLTKLLAKNRNVYEGYLGKARQIAHALLLERSWSKKQILEAYINLIPFRGEFKGISSISWALFDKMPSGLTKTESTLLAVLIRAPNAKSAEWSKRACRQEPELCTLFAKDVEILSLRGFTPTHQEALHLAQRLSRTHSSGFLASTVDKDLQLFIQQTVRTQIRKIAEQNVRDAAVLVVENKTGEVWAYVGGSGENPEALYVDGIQALRQAGSTLKPFLYATAFENNILHANSWIEDSAVDIVFDRGVYKPLNHDRQFYGWVPVKTALGSSLNVPAVKVFKLLNDDSFWTKLSNLHFRKLQEPEHYGPALALGVADVTLEDLTNAYRTLANNGFYSEISFEKKPAKVEQGQAVFTSPAVQEVRKILSENQNRALGFGLESSLALAGTAVKTGTSKDMRDNWCIGFNDRFTVGVWVGNFSGEPMWNVMGISGAAPIWRNVMMWLQEKYSSEVKSSLAQAESPPIENPQKYPQARILYPQDGMILALDPAIPAVNQKMPLIAESLSGRKTFWKINGGKLISASSSYLWTPATGKHTFELYENSELKGRVQVLVK